MTEADTSVRHDDALRPFSPLPAWYSKAMKNLGRGSPL